VTPDHFVFVCRLDGHMCLANAKALAAANITKDSPEVAGGTITRLVPHPFHRRQITHARTHAHRFDT
jgi:predicted amidohydrolase YtcJ